MLHIELSIYFIIILTSIIQSLFGVGVLVFGTPLLLIAGLNFVETLNILLPISMVINLFQFLTNRDFIDKKLLENLFFIVLPLISITLFLGIQFIQMNLSLAVGCVLIFIALLNYFKIDFINLINEKIYFSIMSIIHGLTNLGGALLVGIISSKKFNKIKTRTNISFFYFSFAFIQLITLSINDLLIWKVDNLIYLVMGCTLFALTERFIFVKIKESLFVYLTNILLFFLGLLLIIKSL
tara:strand:+ start:31817 stop:32533 length:717 start_codon:yes stop_codon:yes gene_type:complete